MKPTLVILAAGMASRYGGDKQIDGFGPHQETILEYALFDAIQVGFGKVCFIIRRTHFEFFEHRFAKPLVGKLEVVYAFQEANLDEYGFYEPIRREKPWGTGHALLAARRLVREPFCVINADDFYGRQAFDTILRFLQQKTTPNAFALLGYRIGQTLSDSGPVTRGVCQVDGRGMLERLDERARVYRDEAKTIVFEQPDGKLGVLDDDDRVSMNFWGFTPTIFEYLEPLFVSFVAANMQNPKAEFLIPEAAQQLLQEGVATFKVLPIDGPCFGVTYQADKPLVRAALAELIDEGAYPERLWNSKYYSVS